MTDTNPFDTPLPAKTCFELRDDFIAHVEQMPEPSRKKVLEMAELFFKFATDSDAGLNAFALVSAELTCMYAGDIAAAAKLKVPNIVEQPVARIYVPNFTKRKH